MTPDILNHKNLRLSGLVLGAVGEGFFWPEGR